MVVLLASAWVSSCTQSPHNDTVAGVEDHTNAELRDFIRDLVAIAAATTLPHFRRNVVVENKSVCGFDPVTDADRLTEDAIRAAITQRFPEHGIIGEEGGAHNPTARYQWVVDPIDGTKAFVCGLPTWATLIGLCDESGPVLGLMSQPVVGEYFIGGLGSAERVGRDGRTPLRSRNTGSLSQASLFATSPDMFSPAELSRFNKLSAVVQLTRFGVDSYAYCMLAAGFIDIVAEAGLGYYDIAALVPIVDSAGGVITDWTGEQVRGGGQVLAAANPKLHAAALVALESS